MIIGFVGFKQVGKSTAAKYIESKYGCNRVNFKDGMITEIRNNFPDLLRAIDAAEGEAENDDIESCIDWLFENKPPLMRALMQNYGTEVRRKDDDNYWVKQWKKKVYPSLINTVTDDVRFLNEAEAVKYGYGIIIRLERDDIPTGGTHPSETEQLSIVADYTIKCEANGHDKLYTALDEILRRHAVISI